MSRRSDWRRQAACESRPDLFYGRRGPMKPEARAICRSCPVFVPCLFDALKGDDDHGIRAATTLEDRKRIRAWDRRMRQMARSKP